MSEHNNKKILTPRNEAQKVFVEYIDEFELVIADGPAGTGKTFLAVAKAIEALENQEVTRIILSRPAVEAGEKIGFLPGDMKEKVDPYLRPLYDALYELTNPDKIRKYFEQDIIEVAPLGFMRGRTLTNAFIILDEAQNATEEQMKMFLTRIGQESKMVVIGDTTQVDLESGKRSGFKTAITGLYNTAGIKVHRFNDEDVVRNKLITAILKAFNPKNAY